MILDAEALVADGRPATLADALFLCAIGAPIAGDPFARARGGLSALEALDESVLADLRRAVPAAADAWRARHQLYSAEETEAFLRHYALSKQDLAAYLLGELARVDAEEHGVHGAAPTPARTMTMGVRAAAFAGSLDAIVGNAALCIGLSDHDAADDDVARAEGVIRERVREYGAASVEELGAALGIAPARATALARLKACVSAHIDSLATPEALAAELCRHAFSLTVVHHVLVAFPSRGAAAEALVCAREDGADLLALAGRFGATTLVSEIRVERLLEMPHLVPVAYARAGEMAGPTYNGLDAWDDILVLRREPPSLEDDEVVERVRASLVERVLRPRVAHVRRRRVCFDPTCEDEQDFDEGVLREGS